MWNKGLSEIDKFARGTCKFDRAELELVLHAILHVLIVSEICTVVSLTKL